MQFNIELNAAVYLMQYIKTLHVSKPNIKTKTFELKKEQKYGAEWKHAEKIFSVFI